MNNKSKKDRYSTTVFGVYEGGLEALVKLHGTDFNIHGGY